jgi:hypothetical protein
MFTRVYLKSVVLLLLLTAGGKLVMVFGDVPVLDKASPLIGFISNRTLLLVAGVLEIAVAILMLSGYGGTRMALLAVGALSALFLTFRLMLWATEFQGYCGCLGSLSVVLHLTPDEANRVATGILIYFLAGSWGFAFASSWSKHDCRGIGNAVADNSPRT